MSDANLPFRASLDEYQREAEALIGALKGGNETAEWRFKWLHPEFRGKSVTDVRGAQPELGLADAQIVIAHDYSFETWPDLAAFTEAVKQDGAVLRFEEAVEDIVAGNAAELSRKLREHPDLIRARSIRRHHATLLHYIAANGVEGVRQKTPTNAVEIAKILLDAGAEPDALADMYEQKCTTMSMLVSSCHPANAGLQGALAEVLLDYGAAMNGKGSKWQSAVMTALSFGYLETARILARRGADTDDLCVAAGLGRLDLASRLLSSADQSSRHAALALAAQHGQTDIIRLLLDAGENPNRNNPEGFHSHSTPLHQAVCAGHLEAVKLLLDRGARLDTRDTLYRSTPLGWAIYCEKPAIVEYLRARGAPA